MLLFDRRGEGESEGDGNMFGWGGDRDILAAIAFLKTRPDVDPTRIAGIGLSVGAELMLQTAAGTGDLAAVVSDGAGTRSFAEEMEEFHGRDKWLGLPLLAVKTASVAVFSNTAPPPKLTDLVPRIHQPLFLIWSIDGGVETMNPTYYRLARGPKTIWGVPGVGHLGGFDAHPRSTSGASSPSSTARWRRAGDSGAGPAREPPERSGAGTSSHRRAGASTRAAAPRARSSRRSAPPPQGRRPPASRRAS